MSGKTIGFVAGAFRRGIPLAEGADPEKAAEPAAQRAPHAAWNAPESAAGRLDAIACRSRS